MLVLKYVLAILILLGGLMQLYGARIRSQVENEAEARGAAPTWMLAVFGLVQVLAAIGLHADNLLGLNPVIAGIAGAAMTLLCVVYVLVEKWNEGWQGRVIMTGLIAMASGYFAVHYLTNL